MSFDDLQQIKTEETWKLMAYMISFALRQRDLTSDSFSWSSRISIWVWTVLQFGNGEEQERLRFQSGKKRWGFDLAISGFGRVRFRFGFWNGWRMKPCSGTWNVFLEREEWSWGFVLYIFNLDVGKIGKSGIFPGL